MNVQAPSPGQITRLPNPADARRSLMQLTPPRLALIDRTEQTHAANEHRNLAALNAAELAALGAQLSMLLAAQESPTGQ